MYKKDFDRLIQKHIPQNIFLFGESDFYIDHYTKILIQKKPNSSLSYFYFSDFSLGDVVDILGSGNLFGGDALVILKLDSELSKKECSAITEALKSNPANSLITNFYFNDSKTPTQYMQESKKFSLALKTEDFVDVRFFHPNEQECLDLLRSKSKELKIDISQEALRFLLQFQRQDLALALNELEKYALLNKSIGIEEIKKFSYGLSSTRIDDFIQNLFGQGNFLHLYDKMQEEGLDSMNLLYELERYFYHLFLFCSYAKIYGRCDAKEILGYAPPQAIVDLYVKRALKLKLNVFQEIFTIFQEWRNGVFSGEREVGLRSLIKIKAILC